MKTKAEINQSIRLSDKDIENLSRVDGNVYIFNANSGSVNVKIETTEKKLAEAIRELVENQECGYREVVNIVRRALIEYAFCQTGTVSGAARYLKLKPRSLANAVRNNRQTKQLEILDKNLKKVRSLPI